MAFFCIKFKRGVDFYINVMFNCPQSNTNGEGQMAQQQENTQAQATATVTQDQATKAFEAWEIDYRANPDTFYTPEEVAKLGVATLSEGRAIHFMALLREVA